MSSSARRLLLPLVPAYRLALALRELRLRSGIERVRRLRRPVISVGSLSAGGAGKTPLTIALAKLLVANGFSVDVLSRGYGRKSIDAVRVQPDGTADEFGDEPLLMAREAGVPVYVAPERHDAGLLAEADAPRREPGAQRAVHLLDDGFQHRQLFRNIDILLLGREDWHDHLLPAGNLREPHGAIRRADGIVIPSEEADLESEIRRLGWTRALWRTRRKMEVPTVEVPVAAFCGIARPEQFFRGLESSGMHLATRTAFRDHHRYSGGDVERLVSIARAAGVAALITTEKDKVRLEPLVGMLPDSLPLLTARLEIEIEDEAGVMDWLARHLNGGRIRPTL
jgi:tetraacyldisaccharide 4'-kinase